MLNPITFRVEGGSGPLVVSTNGLDYAAYEDEFDRAAAVDIGAGRYKCWAFMVWHAMVREGKSTATFDEFLGDSPKFAVGEAAQIEELPPLESQAPTGS